MNEYYLHMMAYHTSLRNIGLFISITLALYIGLINCKLLNKYTKSLVILLLIIPLIINYKSLNDINIFINTKGINEKNKKIKDKHRELKELMYWKNLNIYIGIINIIVLIGIIVY